jgi:hypothetical protein
MFRDNHLGQQSRSRRALLNRLRRLARRLHRAVTGVFSADIFDHDQLRRNVFIALAGLFAELAQVLIAGIAMLLGFVQIMHDAFPLQMGGQRTAATTLRPGVVR